MARPSALRWLIGVELSNFRQRAGLTLTDIVERTKIAKPKLSLLENGERHQYPADIEKIMTACGVAAHHIDRLTRLASLADTTTWWAPWSDVVPDWFGTFVGLERLAAQEFVFEPILLPGLLQTPDYAREVTRNALRVRRDHTDRVVEVRMERARRLTDDGHPLALHAIVSDFALKLNVGTPEIRKAQYEYLIELAKRPNVTLQVVTPDCGLHGAVTGQFVVLDFEMAQSIAWSELQDGAMYVQHPGEVDTYQESARSLEAAALSPEDSVGLIADLIK